jgi:hypothetical protein
VVATLPSQLCAGHFNAAREHYFFTQIPLKDRLIFPCMSLKINYIKRRFTQILKTLLVLCFMSCHVLIGSLVLEK